MCSTGSRAHGLQGTRAVVVAARELSTCGSLALEHRLGIGAHGLSCSAAFGIFLNQGIEFMSPALAGGFITTEPTREAQSCPLVILQIIRVKSCMVFEVLDFVTMNERCYLFIIISNDKSWTQCRPSVSVK